MGSWYIMVEDTVRGPYTKEDLRGNLTPSVVVCEQGEENWRPAAEVEELRDCLTPDAAADPREQDRTEEGNNTEPSKDPEGETTQRLPTLERFCELCEHATEDQLLREFAEFYDEYDRKERRALRQELKQRGLWEKV